MSLVWCCTTWYVCFSPHRKKSKGSGLSEAKRMENRVGMEELLNRVGTEELFFYLHMRISIVRIICLF